MTMSADKIQIKENYDAPSSTPGLSGYGALGIGRSINGITGIQCVVTDRQRNQMSEGHGFGESFGMNQFG